MGEWPDRIEGSLTDYLSSVGRIVRRFGDRLDSRSEIAGVERGGRRYVVKAAGDPEAVGWLESALRLHRAVRHPAVATVVAAIATDGGLALVEEWAPGEVLVDSYDPSVLPRRDPRSAYQRFLALPPSDIASAITTLLDAHCVVAAAGFVAVDLYDGCLLYDFDGRRLWLIDLDHYRPGPYVLDVDRQLGSTASMAPEELTRGATIDERTTVFTLGRMALVCLGCAREGPANPSDFRGSPEQFAAAERACAARPEDRFATVADFHAAWLVAA
jgi:serine/threonine-protein kinase